MHFSATITYPTGPVAVAAMLADDTFVERRFAAAGASAHSYEIHRDGETFTITSRLQMPTTMVPASFRSLVGATLDVRMVEAWGAPAADGSRRSTLSLDIQGVPVRVTGSQHLRPTADGTSETYDGEVTASVPLFGRPIEQAATDAVAQVVEAEQEIGTEYLATH
ncbi:MAG: DUF2505 domain-containing protein [Georgenia sp.]